ncbi:ATP-dependent zinc metalloprotease FtsH [Synechococcus sp. Cruz-9H2]|uniref:ATP-dependent zinc metalloprotease FtsH n=1 Tax=unclassified Synechococcus TaxID=2626047 RepID=UPI0020CE8BCA|nr:MULTISPECIES: ATP-dependent zinc metalloprotease FtsH [unclassified Synechococcus]MCP9818447.1 ATP-dependent zinc metalloprotease FtsH [Synechococcus sp. Cruz-9H2]MCP9842676.1 ATP-dependent zinc metalloprotease FtsH [Synechococcus sp. Edmonson 11F2]MCP9855340.1 ATP-dependent zinc metalloprotease FtsH [Synechococcus sp. Cruz-9C9]MCP9862413.1 ATP-dependent zinc metalloprotease FtsH [Synechococcus sp. Cruz-7E5]MCP9869685.1 ATP-dependent zinc metalloprotease FtsH [Synechococcus sp. Cruz-7B9]
MGRLVRQPEPIPSYSELLTLIKGGTIKELELSPRQREVQVQFKDGRSIRVPVFANDSLLLRTAEQSSVPLTVRDDRQDDATAGLLVNVLLVVLLLGGLTLLLRRSSQVASKAMGFGRSQPRLQPEGSVGVRFEDVAGINEAKAELQEVVSFLRQPERFTALGAKIPKGVLLVGPPGTGKTLLAKAIAGEAGVPFFSMAASEFVELFVGVGASRVRDLFKRAKEKAPCIIFIDEVDAVGRQRGAGIGGGNDEREQTLNQLLTEMDGFEQNSGVILIAATNRPDVLDAALTRPGRFDRQIQVDLPDRLGREAILAVHARSRPLDPSVSLSTWAARTPGFSGADLANLLNEGAILTARRQRSSIDDQALSDALERITMGLAVAPLQDSAKKRLIAYHEIGHALLSTLVPHADKLDKVTLLPRSGGVGGFARTMPDEEILDSGLISKAYLQARLVVVMGGRAAELVVFGPSEITQGASGDLQMATRISREMVTRYGFSPLGQVALEGDGHEVFLGRDLIHTRPSYAESTGSQIDLQVRQLSQQALDQALALLRPRRALMDELVDRLIEQETLGGDDFRAIVDSFEASGASPAEAGSQAALPVAGHA